MVGYLLRAFKKFFFPSFCYYCCIETAGYFLCDTCLETIISIATKTLFITEKYQAKVFAISAYQDPVKYFVSAKHIRYPLANRYLAELLWTRTDLKNAEFDLIVPVPTHWKRYAYRWYNQSEVMAEQLSRLSGRPVVRLLKKNGATKPQTSMRRIDRVQNLLGAFSLQEGAELYKHHKVLLVDDVMTTGTTLKSCIKTLLGLRPEKISVAVGCRTL